MATAKRVSNLAVVVSADTVGVTKGLEQAQKSVSNFSAAMAGSAFGQLMGGKLAGATGLLGGLIGGPGGAAAGVVIGSAIDSTFGAIASSISAGASLVSSTVKQMLTVGGEYELAIAAFSAQVGSDAGGKSLFKGIQNLAVATTFTTQQLSQQARILIGYGIAADKVVPTLTKLALIAQKSGRGETGLAGGVLAFAQSSAIGKLQGQERRQFGEAGIGAEDFARTLGVTTQRFMEMMEAGQVGFDVVAKTINRLGSEAGTSADKINKTMIGAFNSVKESAENSMGEIGMQIIKAFAIPETLLKIGAFLGELPAKVQQLTPYLEKARAIIEPIAKGFYAAGVAIGTAAKNLVDSFIPSMKDTKDIAENIGRALAVGVGMAIDLALKLGRTLLAATMPIAQMIDKILPFITDVKFPSFAQANIQTGATISGMISKAGPGGYAGIARNAFKDGFPGIDPLNPKLDQSGAAEGVKAIAPAIQELAKSINDGMGSGKGQGAFAEFQSSFANLMAAEQQGLIQNKAGADAFLFGEFKKLTGSLTRMENTLPAAIDKNTVEGQARIEKVIANTQSKGMDDVPALLRQAKEVAEKQLRQQQMTVDQLRRLAPQIPLLVG
jgi:tape measure domain-containing protein